jgi:hypothetical protein
MGATTVLFKSKLSFSLSLWVIGKKLIFEKKLNAFKTNAWMQISHLSEEEAKEKYIEMINELLTKKNKK